MSVKAKRSHRRFFTNNLTDYNAAEQQSMDKTFLISEIHNKALLCFDKQSYKEKDNIDGGLYVGVSGIAYMLYYIGKSETFKEEKDGLLRKCNDILQVCWTDGKKRERHSKDSSDRCAFLLGNAGLVAVSAAVAHYSGQENEAKRLIEEYKKIAPICSPISYTSFGGDELFVGRAGYLCGAIWLNKEFKKKVIPDEILDTICKSIMMSGRKYAERHNSPCPLMFAYYGAEYLGAAHGLCSILQMLLSCDTFLAKNNDAEMDIKLSVDYLLSLQTSSGNFPCALDEIEKNSRPEHEELIHWCHGAPGVVYLLAKAYLRWKEDKYLNSAIKCGEITWKNGLLTKGPGICHGVAGSGYVFLLLYRLTQDVKYLHRAYQFAKFMSNSAFLEGARTPDMPYSLYEGYAGTVCFLQDLIEPEKAAFPFMDVF